MNMTRIDRARFWRVRRSLTSMLRAVTPGVTNGFAIFQAGLYGYVIDPRKVRPASLTESITPFSIRDDTRRVREQLPGGDSFGH